MWPHCPRDRGMCTSKGDWPILSTNKKSPVVLHHIISASQIHKSLHSLEDSRGILYICVSVRQQLSDNHSSHCWSCTKQSDAHLSRTYSTGEGAHCCVSVSLCVINEEAMSMTSSAQYIYCATANMDLNAEPGEGDTPFRPIVCLPILSETAWGKAQGSHGVVQPGAFLHLSSSAPASQHRTVLEYFKTNHLADWIKSSQHASPCSLIPEQLSCHDTGFLHLNVLWSDTMDTDEFKHQIDARGSA